MENFDLFFCLQKHNVLRVFLIQGILFLQITLFLLWFTLIVWIFGKCGLICMLVCLRWSKVKYACESLDLDSWMEKKNAGICDEILPKAIEPWVQSEKMQWSDTNTIKCHTPTSKPKGKKHTVYWLTFPRNTYSKPNQQLFPNQVNIQLS